MRRGLKARIIDALDAGEDRRAIAERLGCALSTVHNVAAQLRIRAERRSTPLRDAIVTLFPAALTDHEIARRVGCDRSYVTMIRRDLGIALVPARRGRTPVLDAAKVDALLAAGLTQREASQRLGLSASAIGMHLHRRKRAGEVSPAGPSIPATTPHHSLTETDFSTLAPLP